MNETIWKFPLEVTDSQSVKMPKASRILSVQTQGGQPCLWAWVDSEAPLETRTFHTFGTGHPMRKDARQILEHVGTYQLNDGALVFHVFEAR